MVDDNNEEQNNNDVEMIPDEEMFSDVPAAEEKIKKLKGDLKQCNIERKDYLDGWQRAKADFVNYRKDEASRFEDTARFVTAGLIQEMLPVLDSFDLALSHGMPKDVEKGILIIRSQFMDILKKRGLEEMQSIGKKFDPEFHESVGEIESEKEESIIVEEIQKGYVIKGRVLRPARVKIAKKKSET
ncbi:nucleotide exchange factor GrpE [Patescibacteria group bacterium]|nr:nucleotide exchange factor GrpE [Patescibacteria group bacterium]